LTRVGLEGRQIEQVVVGCVSPGPDEANIARIVALRLGCGDAVPGLTVQRNCGSGMQALETAALEIAHGRADLLLAGGTEAMSRYPMMLNESMVAWLSAWSRARTLQARGRALLSLRPGHLVPVVALLCGLRDPVVGLSMGQTAEQLATDFGIGREAMDELAIESHRRLARAREHGRLAEIEPVYDRNGGVYEHDDGLRAGTTLADLARLRPAFDRPVGQVTAGNSAQVTDGAAMLLLASEHAATAHNLPVLGRLLDSEWAALDPARMGLGPVYAMAPIMRRQGLASEDLDAWEINEAFAAQVLACLSAWQDGAFCREQLGMSGGLGPIAREHLNVDGGAISIGHPVGASGARIVLHLLKVLERSGGRRGMASLCIGGGQGGAMLVERV
jgi:acetyl-CoA C-acetyltransferase